MPDPAPTQPPVAHEGYRRWWRIGQTAGAHAAARVVSGVSQLALVPLLLGHLGAATFGWMMMLVALLALTAFADLGVGVAVQQALAQAWGRDDGTKLRNTYANGMRLLIWLGLGWLALILPVAWWLGPRLMAAPAGISTNSQHASWLVVAFLISASVPASAGARLAAAIQAGWVHAVWMAAVNVVLLGATAIAVQAGAGPLVCLALMGAAQVVPGFCAGLHIARRLAWHRAPPAVHDRHEQGRLWHEGLRFAPQQLTGALLSAATPAAVLRFGGFEGSAAFAVFTRLFGLVVQGHALLLGPFWPAYAEAHVRHDWAWTRRTLAASLALSGGCAAVVLSAAAFLHPITRAWLGAGAALSAGSFAWCMAGWHVATISVLPFNQFLLGHGRLQRLTWPIVAVNLVTVTAMAVLGAIAGGTGVAAALLGGTALGLLPLALRETMAVWHPQ